MTSSKPLPTDAIQRILFIAPSVHIYSIPPLTTTKGYTAALWTADNNRRQIFTARLRVLETAIPSQVSNDPGGEETLSTEILLEDPSDGQLFAAAPYTDPGAVEAVLDSARFFAVRVVGEGGRKAVLGIGFEERGEAIDFGICLQEVERVLSGGRKMGEKEVVVEKKDFSLKEGQTIHVDIGRKGRRKGTGVVGDEGGHGNALFSIKPPPDVQKGGRDGVGLGLLPPPPSAQEMKAEKRRSRQGVPEVGSAAAMGFDDGEFGEFQ